MRPIELEEADLGDVLAEVVESAKELTRVEIALARQEAERDVSAFRRAAMLAGAAIFAGSVSVALLVAALAMYLGSALLAACVGGGAGLFGVVFAALAHRSMPTEVLERTRLRAANTLRTVEEEI